MHFRRPATGPNHSPARRSLRVAAAAAAAGLALSACSAGETRHDDSERAPAQTTEICVMFSYSKLRENAQEPAPRTAEAIVQLLPVAYTFAYGDDIPLELTAEVSAGVDPASNVPRTVEDLGQQVDDMFQAQHPGLGDGGAVPDDRSSLCYIFDLLEEKVQVGPGSYVLPFTFPGGIGRESVRPTVIQPGATAQQ